MASLALIVHARTSDAQVLSPATVAPVDTQPEMQPEPPRDAYLLRLGQHFDARGMHYRAIGTYEELAFATSDPVHRREAHVRIAVSYHRGHQYAEALRAYDALLADRTVPFELGDRLRLVRLVATSDRAFDEGTTRGLDATVAQLAPLLDRPDRSFAAYAHFHRTRLFLQDGRTRDAHRALSHTEALCTHLPSLPACTALPALREAFTVRPADTRSPVLGALLSVLVPGAGAAYSARWIDAGTYFALTVGPGLLAWNVYDTARPFGEQQATFYVLGIVGAAFYVASVIQGAVAAERFNEIERERHRRQIFQRMPSPLPL